MKFELRWTLRFATTFFGQMIRAGGSISVPANLAVQMHDEEQGWVCSDIEAARQSLATPVPAVVLGDTEPEVKTITHPVVTEEGVSVVVDVVPDVLQQSMQPALALTGEATPPVAPKPFPCDLCTEGFNSKKKLTAHKARVHQNQDKTV